MALIAILLAASLTAEPPQLVLGKDEGAQLILKDAPAGAKVSFSSSAGTVSEAKRDGDTFRARLTPPVLRAPTVALVLARIDDGGARELAWLSIPLAGSDTMEIETKPGAKVEVDVQGKLIGPVTADKRGTARLPMIVPPGVSSATLRISDKLGNKSEKPLDLEPPPFSRLRVAARQDGFSSAAPADLEIFVVKPDGTPDDDAKVELHSDDGDAEVRRRIGHGVWLGRFVAPPNLSGPARVEAKANGQLAAVDLPYRASEVALAQPPWRSALAVQAPWSVSVGPMGGGGGTWDGSGAATVLLEGAMRLEILPIEAVLDVGGSWFAEVTQFGANPTNSEKAKAKSQFFQLGARAGRQLSKSLDWHFSVLAGALHQVVDRTLPNGTQVQEDGWTARLAAALGVNVRAGPGRFIAQVQLDTSSSAVAGLSAGLGSVQVLAGYLVTVY